MATFLQAPTAAPRRTLEIVLALTRADIRMRYGRGPLTRVKWLLDPIAALGIYLVLVSFVLNRAGNAVGLSVACAVVPFQLVIMTVANSLRAVELRRSIVANMAFPRSLIPVAATLTEGVGFAACLLLLPAMMAIYGIAPTPAVLLLPFVVATTFAFAVALAYPATLLGMWTPELATFVVSATRVLFFVAPGLVALRDITGRAADVLKLNPLAGIFEAYRAVLLEGVAPAAWMLLIPLGYAALIAAIFVPIYRAEQRHFAKLLL